MRDAKQSEVSVIRYKEKVAVRFVTPSGVTAGVATSIAPELVMRKLRTKLERKLRARRDAMRAKVSYRRSGSGTTTVVSFLRTRDRLLVIGGASTLSL
jgi:hypothetical protein